MYYTVVSGDTLWDISQRFSVPIEQIQQRNHMRTNLIYPSQILILDIPDTAENVIDSSQYRVRLKDTLSSIAHKFATSAERLMHLNGLSTDLIYPDQIIQVRKKATSSSSRSPSELVVKAATNRRQIALTYDAGGDDAVSSEIMDILKKFGVKSTFFLTGKWVENFPELARRIVSEGHEIGNHTYSHPDLTKLSSEEIIDQLEHCEDVIYRTTSAKVSPFFRPPFGAWNNETLQAIGTAGYPKCIYWSIDSIDWQHPPVESIVGRILEKAGNGDIVLMHLGGYSTGTATDLVIPQLQAKGFDLVTIGELMA